MQNSFRNFDYSLYLIPIGIILIFSGFTDTFGVFPENEDPISFEIVDYSGNSVGRSINTDIILTVINNTDSGISFPIPKYSESGSFLVYPFFYDITWKPNNCSVSELNDTRYLRIRDFKEIPARGSVSFTVNPFEFYGGLMCEEEPGRVISLQVRYVPDKKYFEQGYLKSILKNSEELSDLEKIFEQLPRDTIASQVIELEI